MYKTSVYTLVNGDMQKGDIIQQHIDS